MKAPQMPLWLLIFSILISIIAAVYGFYHSGTLTSILEFISCILGIIALIKLATRNRRLVKARNYMIAHCVLLLFIALALRIHDALFIVFLTILSILGATILRVLTSYHQLYGLADVADDAEHSRLAQRLRQLFFFYIAVAVLTLIGVIPDLTSSVKIGSVFLSTALNIYQMSLYYLLMKTKPFSKK